MGSSEPFFGRACVGLLVLVGVLSVAAGCSSSPSGPLTSSQRADLAEAAKAYERSDSETSDAFEAKTVVPRLEHWQETEYLHQKALVKLRDDSPDGACRAAVQALLVVEDGQNVIRLRLIDHYRQEQFGLVAEDTVAYGVSVVNGARQAEDAVATACGRSSVDPSKVTSGASSLTPVQNSDFEAVLAAYDQTRAAFTSVFSTQEFVADLKSMRAADVPVTAALDTVIGSLGEGACRSSLIDLRSLETQQASLRDAMISAGEAGDLVTMITKLGEYAGVNATSDKFTKARASVSADCGVSV